MYGSTPGGHSWDGGGVGGGGDGSGMRVSGSVGATMSHMPPTNNQHTTARAPYEAGANQHAVPDADFADLDDDAFYQVQLSLLGFSLIYQP